MTTKTKREIECLSRLQELTSQMEDILIYLKLEGLVDDNQMKSIKLTPDRPKEVQAILKDLQANGKLQMLTYEWSLLPVENITITIITDRNQREFIFTG